MKVIITLLILFAPFLSSAQSNAFCFTFEQTDSGYLNHIIIDTADTNNLWQIGIPDKPVFDSAYSYPNAIVTDTLNPYPASNVSSFIMAFPNWINYAFEFRFHYRLDIDTGDFAQIEVSTDSGFQWYNLTSDFTDIPSNTPSNFATSTIGWQCATTNWFTDFNNDSGSVLIRFTFTSDSIPSAKDGWMIDDICISYYFDHVEERYNNNLISIHPNPSNGHIKLQSKTTTRNATAQVYNLSGQKVFETNIIPKDGDLYLPLPDGMYVLKYSDERDIAVKRIVIQH